MMRYMVLLVLLWAAPLHAATYYVNNSSGDDARACVTAQTSSTPKKTISSGVACMGADGGHVTEMFGGTYTGTLNALISTSTTINGGPSWDSPNTIRARAGEVVTIANTGTANIIAFTSATQRYLIISDVILDASLLGGESGVVYLGPGSHHIRLQDFEAFGADAYAGISTAETNGGDNEFLRCEVHDNGEGWTPPGHGFYLSSPRNLIEGCNIYDNAGYGIQLYAGNTDGNIIRSNWIHDNAFDTGTGGGIVAGTGATSSVGGVKIYNNIISGTHPDGYGIQVSGYYGTIANDYEVLNNTILAADAVLISDSADGTLLKNNILRTVNNAGAGSIVNNGVGTVQTTNLTSDPAFTNGSGSYRQPTDFQIQTTSPAKNTGTSVAAVRTDYAGVLRPVDGVYDIGAYEFAQGTPVPVPVPAPEPIPEPIPAPTPVPTPTPAGLPPPTPCVYSVSVSSQLFTAAGGTAAITLTTQAGCRWTVTDQADWLSVSSNNGTGPRMLTMTVRGFNGTGSRTTSVVVAGQVFQVRQTQP